jgi:hypothetical protein
MIKLS